MRRLLASATALLPPALCAGLAQRGRARLIAASGLFDVAWYRERYPDAHGRDPVAHYLRHGATRAPNPLFRGDWYLAQNPDVRAAGMNPLLHYLLHGAAEGRMPNPLFDGARYLKQNPDVAAAGQNPLAHYLRNGAAEGRPAHPLSQGQWHLERRLDPQNAAAPTARQSAPVEMAQRNTTPFTFDAAGLTTDAERALAEALAAAAAQGRHLLVLMGPAPSSDAIHQLVAALAADPMIGCAIPRFSDSEGRVLPLPSAAMEMPAYDRQILQHLPTLELVPELAAACVLVRHELAANFPARSVGLRRMPGALRLLMTWGRRLGYRTAIVNRCVVPAPADGAYPQPDADEQRALTLLFPDVVQADARFRELAAHRREALLGRAFSIATEQRRLLIDCTGMPAHHNGTSECILGILRGISELDTDWRIDVLAGADAINFHGLRERWGFARVIEQAAGTYAIAIRPSQPWSLASIAELHRHALAVVVMMLDTIAWDIVYLAGPEVERTWRFAAAHLDGILHISEFTRDRFNLRFPVAPHVRQHVMHLSCHADDYPTHGHAEQRTHILLVGNDYDHKALPDTLLALAHAFPDRQFVAIGYDGAAPANVRAFASGRLTAAEIDALHTGARLLVFPSFYEGFGFPVVRGLAHGVDVVARRSALLTEIAGHCRGQGRIIPFDDPPSLIAAVAGALADRGVETLPLGGRLHGNEPPRCRDVAAQILAFAGDLTAAPTCATHDAREAALRLVWPAQGRP